MSVLPGRLENNGICKLLSPAGTARYNMDTCVQSIGANPPNALIGCLSPYTYIDSQEGLALAKGLIDNSGLQGELAHKCIWMLA